MSLQRRQLKSPKKLKGVKESAYEELKGRKGEDGYDHLEHIDVETTLRERIEEHKHDPVAREELTKATELSKTDVVKTLLNCVRS